jgi:hypothetical protein
MNPKIHAQETSDNYEEAGYLRQEREEAVEGVMNEYKRFWD